MITMPLCLLTLLGAGPTASAANPDLQLHKDRLQPDETTYYFGNAVALGDANGDGHADAVIASDGNGRVYFIPGTVDGLDLLASTRLESAAATSPYSYGADVAFGDFDIDGFQDVVVGDDDPSTTTGGGVWLFPGDPAGPSSDPDALILPAVPTGKGIDGFGFGLSTGDLDGDGYDDLAVGANNARPAGTFGEGAAYLYFGSDVGLGIGTEVVLYQDPPQEEYHFGGSTAIQDFDGDGVGDLAVACAGVGPEPYLDICSTVYVYTGGTRALDEVEPLALEPSDLDLGVEPYNDTRWAARIAGGGDLDHDGYGDLLVGSLVGFYVFAGSSASVRQDAQRMIRRPSNARCLTYTFGLDVAGVGDVDGDGVDDLATSCNELPASDEGPSEGYIFFGQEGPGPSREVYIPIQATEAPYSGRTWVPLAGGDVDGDGHSDILVGAPLEGTGFFPGAAYLYRPVCTWYLDADGDGYGSDAQTLATCDPPGAGWAEDADDCDDSDADTHPGATDTPEDGIDQDCDGADAEPEPEDTGPVAQGPELGELAPGRSGCGCASGRRAPVAGWLVVCAAAALRSRAAAAGADEGNKPKELGA